MSGDFDWSEAADAGEIVVPQQAAIAIYENEGGDIVIRQEDHPGDHLIFVHPFYLPQLIAALEQLRIKKQRNPGE